MGKRTPFRTLRPDFMRFVVYYTCSVPVPFHSAVVFALLLRFFVLLPRNTPSPA